MKPKIEYYDNGRVWTESWRNEAEHLHRLDGPAFQSWYENGQLMQKLWFIDGEFHRLDGPAYQGWTETGQLEDEEWYINGVEYETETEYLVAVDLYKANEIADLF